MQQLSTPLTQHARQLIEQVEHLLPDQRNHHAKQRRQRAQEQQKDNPHRQRMRQPTLQARHQPLQQVGQHDTREQRRQLVAKGNDDRKAQRQHHCQHDRFFIREITLNPALKDF